jgi:murein L,D-transpeptidase YcbB/YkuD
MDFSWGWVGLPNWAIKSLDGFVGQLKQFFTHMTKPPSSLVHVTQSKMKTTVHGFLPDEEEKLITAYNDNPEVKKKYPTVNDFLEAQAELKKKKSTKKKSVELKLWSSGPLVKKLQKYLGIKVDGKFQEGTELAVKKWQKKNGLTQDGVVGPATWKKMT